MQCSSAERMNCLILAKQGWTIKLGPVLTSTTDFRDNSSEWNLAGGKQNQALARRYTFHAKKALSKGGFLLLYDRIMG